MADRYLMIGLVLITLIFGPAQRAPAYFEDSEETVVTEEKPEVFQNSEFLLMQEDPGQNRFFALVKDGSIYKYVQFNAYYNQVYSITNLFNLEDLTDSVSAVDLFNRRFFFTTGAGNQSILYVLGLDSGEILNLKRLDYKIRAMDYDGETDMIIGLAQNKNGNTKTVSIDPYSCKMNSLADLSRTYSMDYDSAFLRADKKEVWVAASSRRNEYVLTISTVTGKASAIRVISVEPDDQLVYNFNTMKFNQVLFAPGTKNSIFLTGFNEMYKTAFIFHLTINSKDLKDRIEHIHKQLLEYSPGGIADYQLKLIYPKPFENFTAYSMAVALESKIKEIYGIEEIAHKEFFIGKPYKIIISAEGLSIY